MKHTNKKYRKEELTFFFKTLGEFTAKYQVEIKDMKSTYIE